MIGGNPVKIDFTMAYEADPKYCEVGYHTTFLIHKDHILKQGFVKSNNSNEWLGEGVYFWDCEENALWWKKSSRSIKRCILVCELSCPRSSYLDLDNPNQMEKFDLYLKKYMKEFKKTKALKPKFANNNECRKFYCDIYCSHNNICILSFTFEHDKISSFGFKVGVEKRRQICVRDESCISIMEVKEGLHDV